MPNAIEPWRIGLVSVALATCLIARGAPRSIGRSAQANGHRLARTETGTIRVWGSPADASLIERIESGFRRTHGAVYFANAFHGPESTFASVNLGVADIAFMARELRVPLETMAFEWEHHYAPFEIDVANAGLGRSSGPDGREANLAFLVNERNPLSCITLMQADDAFAADHRRGGVDADRWGNLTSSVAWKNRPIHVYGPPIETFAAVYLRSAVLDGSRKWNPHYREMAGDWNAVLAAVVRDPDAIAFAPPLPRSRGVKALRLADARGAPCIALDAQSVTSGAYPMLRKVDVALDRRPGTAIDSKVAQFLRYLLSPHAQRIIAGGGFYLPLGARDLRLQLRRLE